VFRLVIDQVNSFNYFGEGLAQPDEALIIHFAVERAHLNDSQINHLDKIE
jgi:hypothetical protein